MSRARKRPPVAEPEEGSPADWFARGYRQGVSDGSGAATRELAVLRTHIRPVVERLAELARLTASLDSMFGELITETSKRWGQAQYGTGDRWQAHPMYLLRAQLFREMDECDHPVLVPDRSKRSRPKTDIRKAAVPRPEPRPTLTLDKADAPTEPERDPQGEARRAAGRAWRA